jgi:O-antigen ligase
MDLDVLKRVYHNPVTILALVYLFTAVLSAIYPGTVNNLEKELIQITLIVLSLFVIAQFVIKNPELFTRILLIGVVAVALVAFYHLYKFYFVEANSYSRRLSGYFLPGNPLHLAGSYGFSFMVSVLLLIKYRRQPLMVALLAVSGGVIFLAIIATQCRSFFLALLVAMVISYAGLGKKSFILIILFTITVILLGLYINPEILERTHLYRLQIWQDVLQLILEKPFFGWGADYDPTIQVAGNTLIDTHNIFLMVWLKYGALSLAALLLLYGYSLVVIRKNRDNELLRLGGALLVFGVGMLFFEGHDIITKPNRMWLMVWVPLGIVMGAEYASTQLNRKAG